MKIIQTTGRLLLREFTTADASFIIQLLNTSGWLQFIGDRNVHTAQDAENYLLNGPMKSYTDNGFGLWAVTLKETGEVMGMCGLIKRVDLDDIDIGFALLPEYSGKGYAHEAAEATIRYGIDRLGLGKIVAITMAENTHSISLLKKIGLEFEKKVQVHDEELLLFATANN